MVGDLKSWIFKSFSVLRSLDAIVFIHWGDADYCDFVLRQAVKSNPKTRKIFVTDRPRCWFPAGWTCIPLDEYDASFEELRPYYQNFSPNHPDYEYKCFARWFIIRDVCHNLRLKNIIHVDSDVLLFQDMSLAYRDLGRPSISASHGCCGEASFWNVKTLEHFCSYVTSVFKDEKNRIHDFYENNRAVGELSGYSDMSAIAEFIKLRGAYTETTQIFGDYTFDHNLNISRNGRNHFKMDGGLKKLCWFGESPYGELRDDDRRVRFATLHFQGEAKLQISNIYQASSK